MAYPRGRGGNKARGHVFRRAEGLSPRARGKPEVPEDMAEYWGPIPAGAGETTEKAQNEQRSTAYPRGRGGNPAESGVCLK